MNRTVQLKKVQVISNEAISETSCILRFRRNFDFSAGQVLNITTHATLAPRMYSIASGEKDENIEILYKIVPKGELTPKLELVKKSDSLLISAPFGKFLGTSEAAVFIATGTGIAPFISMLRSGASANKIVLHGSRTQDDFYYRDELEKLLGENYIRCYSGAAPTDFFHGRVTDYLSQELPGGIQNKYYLCGSAEMVVETRDLLIDRGISFQNVFSEIYF